MRSRPVVELDPLSNDSLCMTAPDDELCTFAQVSGMFDLQLLSYRFWQRLVVGHFNHDRGDRLSEGCLELSGAGISIFNGVV